MSTKPNPANFPPVRACIFDVDGLLINSEDIYTQIYNNILHSYHKPDLPWRIKAKQQSRGREGMHHLLAWAQLPISYDDWTAKVTAQHPLFKTCTPLPGIPTLLSTLSSPTTTPPLHLALASSATRTTFQLKTSHLPCITSPFPVQNRVFGDDAAMSDKRKKPMPDCFLLALERINKGLREGERRVEVGECLVFEDSVAGVEAGRGAGMRVCWCPQEGLRGFLGGREGEVLEGRGGGVEEGQGGEEEEEEGDQGFEGVWEGERRLWSEDGRAEMVMSLEEFDYEFYGIQVERSGV